MHFLAVDLDVMRGLEAQADLATVDADDGDGDLFGAAGDDDSFI